MSNNILLKQYIKQVLTEAFVDSEGNPYKYYYFSDMTKNGALNGLLTLSIYAEGFSDSPSIIREFINTYDYFIIMDGKEFRQINSNFEKINYEDPDNLLKNNLYNIKRITNDVIRKEIGSFRMRFEDEFRRELARSMPEVRTFYEDFAFKDFTFFAELPQINNFNDFFEIIYNDIISYTEEHYKYRSTKDETVQFIKDNKDEFRNIIYRSVIAMARPFKRESELLSHDKVINVPKGSKIFFLGDYEKDYKDIRGEFKREFIKEVVDSNNFIVKIINPFKAEQVFNSKWKKKVKY